MKNIGDILDKIKSGELNIAKLSKETGISAAKMYKWKGRGTNITAADAYKLADWLEKSPKMDNPEINESKNVFSGMSEAEDVTLREPIDPYLKPKTKKIPFYDAEASAGDISVTEMTPISAPSGTIDVGDLLSDSQAAIRIYGNSMLPNYPPGCVVGLSKVASSFIQPGEVYVIETRDQRVLKRLFYKNDDTDSSQLTLYSDNIMKFEGGARHGKLAYPPYDVPKDEIVNIFIVTGVIKRNTNSVIINR